VQHDQNCVLVHAAPELFPAGPKLHSERAEKDRPLTDCISFYVMGKRGMACALAYDVHFELAGFEPLLRRDPPN